MGYSARYHATSLIAVFITLAVGVVIGAALGMGWVMASVRHLRNHLFGNVVLSRFPISNHSQYDLSWRTCEPRACQRADLDLGHGRRERRAERA